MAAQQGSQDCCSQCLSPLSKPLSTHASSGDSRTLTGKSDSVSCEVTAPFSWLLVHTEFCCDLRESVSPVLWNFCIQIPCGFSVPLLNPQAGKSIVGPRTFAAVWKHLWYNCSACGSSARLLSGGANGDLLQEDLGRTLCLPGLLQAEPLSPRQVTADLCLHRRHSNTQRQVWLSLLWRSLLISLGPGAHKVFLHPLKISGRYEVWF